MRLNQQHGFGGNSSSFYKQKTAAKRGFLAKTLFYAQTMTFWVWNLLRKWGWVISSGFVILVLPSIVMQMLEYESMYAKEMALN
jgi:hypothetical protein